MPPEHGMRDNFAPPLPESMPTLAELLKREGFETAAFVSAMVLSARTGLSRGFDVYRDEFEAAGGAPFLNSLQRRGDETLRDVEAWLERRERGRRFFAWVHLYDPHDPYEPPEPFASRYRERPYDGEVAWSDELVGRLVATLARLDLLEDALLVVTSDHGEGLGEHEESLHGFFVYESTLRVPLLFRGPGIPAGSRIEAPVRLTDVFPTALDLLGLGNPVESRGLAPALRGLEPVAEEPVYAESLVPRLHFGWSELRALREGDYKLIEAPRPELYDLVEDPSELRNLADRETSRLASMRERLRREIERMEASRESGEDLPSEEVRRQLGALGYLGLGGSTGDPGADPKDKIEEFRLASGLMREALLKLQDGELEQSVELFERLLALGVESYEIRLSLGRALVELARFGEAAPHLQAALRLQPGSREASALLAQCHAALGDRLRDEHRLEEAARELRRAVELDPGPPEYWNSLGTALGAAASWEESAQAFRNAIERSPNDPRYAYNLGLALLRSGQTTEAAEQFRRTLELNPAFQPARDRLAEMRK